MTRHATGVRRRPLALLALLMLAAATPGVAQAPSRKRRTSLDIEYLVLSKGQLTLRPFARAERRFRSTGLAYEHWNAGLRLRISPWLSGARRTT